MTRGWTRQAMALFTWMAVLFAIPLLCWWGTRQFAASSNLGGAFLTLLVLGSGGVALLVGLIGAGIVGAVTRTKTASLAGALCGAFVALAVVNSLNESQQQTDWAPEWAQYQELRDLIALARTGDASAIAARLGTLRHLSLPRAVCQLTKDDPVNGYSHLFGERDPGSHAPLTIAQVMTVAEAAAAASAPTGHTEASLYAVLAMLTRRDTVASFPAWIGVWKKAHGGGDLRHLAIATPYDGAPDCAWGSTELLAETPLSAWRDPAITAWLASGLAFLPEQQRHVLNAVDRAATLQAAVKSGVNPNAVEPGREMWPVLVSNAAPWGWRTHNEADPDEVAQLVEEFVRQGADTQAADPESRTACDIVSAIEACPCEGEAPAHRHRRLQASERIRKAVCTGKP